MTKYALLQLRHYLNLVKKEFYIQKRESLDVGTFPTFKIHYIGTVPTFKMHDAGTLPMCKTHHQKMNVKEIKQPKKDFFIICSLLFRNKYV